MVKSHIEALVSALWPSLQQRDIYFVLFRQTPMFGWDLPAEIWKLCKCWKFQFSIQLIGSMRKKVETCKKKISIEKYWNLKKNFFLWKSGLKKLFCILSNNSDRFYEQKSILYSVLLQLWFVKFERICFLSFIELSKIIFY